MKPGTKENIELGSCYIKQGFSTLALVTFGSSYRFALEGSVVLLSMFTCNPITLDASSTHSLVVEASKVFRHCHILRGKDEEITFI